MKNSYLQTPFGDKRHTFNFEQVEVLATECMEGPRRIIEAVYTELRTATIYIAAEVLSCYYQILKKSSYKNRQLRKKFRLH